MATVTYNFNAYSSAGAAWLNPNNAIDGSVATYANVDLGVAGTIYLSANNCPGTHLGRITAVEVRVYAYGYETGLPDACILKLQPEFGGTLLGTLATVFNLTNATYGPQWSSYIDITNDTNHPVWGVDWNDIKNLDLNVYGERGAGALTAVYLYEAEVRVTYVPYVPEQVI